MNDVLLQTKLYIPRLRPSLILRPRLLAKLDQGLDPHTAFFSGRIALICAPAGYGKTTLAGEWLVELKSRTPTFRRQNGRVCWLSLDEQDNDPGRFLTYLIATLQRALPGLGKEVQTALASAQPVPTDTLVTYLVNDLDQLEQPIVLVLDDYHQIREQAIHHSITFLVDNQPPNLYLVLTARRNPPFPLARWRARGHLVEVRRDDLKFTRQEIETFFQQATGVNLDQDSLKTLEQKTEGWVASLQLAAIAVQAPQGQPDESNINRLVKSFSGTHQYIVDYLLSEVMAQRPSGTRQFLLQTSILDRFTPSLCTAVTGQEDSQATIEQLEAANLFLIPLDERRRWYRYHHLFAALLRQRLKAQEPDLIPKLYLRASLWHEAHGFLEEAIEAALAGGHLERAAGLISDAAHTTVWLQGQYSRLARWIGQLPEELVCQWSQLCVYFAWVLYVDPQQEDKRAPIRWLDAAEKAVAETEGQSQEGRAILGQAAAIRSSRARIQGDIAGTIVLSAKALNQLPAEPSWFRENDSKYQSLEMPDYEYTLL